MTLYLDNAATSWPKPPCVAEAMLHCMREVGASPGRSGHRLATEAERIRFGTREALAELVGVSDPMRIVFALNATQALNMVIRGLLGEGDHVVTTSMEHNSVMRPLRAAERAGASVSVVGCNAEGTLAPEALAEHILPRTKLIVVNHASNVCGTLLPIRKLGRIARRLGIPFLVDAAQTAGSQPINLVRDNIDLLAFAGHKSLLGPSGTGGLVFHDEFDIDLLPPLIYGGTGSLSEEETQPDFLPDKYEGGTSNIVGLAGLGAGVRYVLDRGVEGIHDHEGRLTKRLLEGLRGIDRIRLLGTMDARRQTATVSFTIDGKSVSETAHALDERFGIMCRPGLHCAPRAHRTLGTLPAGAIRFAPGLFSTEADIDRAVEAVAMLADEE